MSVQEAGFFFHMALTFTTNSWTSFEISIETGAIRRLSVRLHLAHCVEFKSHSDVKLIKQSLKAMWNLFVCFSLKTSFKLEALFRRSTLNCVG